MKSLFKNKILWFLIGGVVLVSLVVDIPTESPVVEEPLGSQEIIVSRNYNSNTIDNGDGTFTLKAHAGHINYKDENGDFQPSDISFTELSDRWQMTKHNYELEVAKDFSAPLLMRYRNKYEGANHTITYEPFAIAWYNHQTEDLQIFRSQQSVQGVQNGNSIYYTNAFGNGVDFEITLQRSGFKKEVVIPNKPNVFPTAPGEGYRLVALFKYGGSGLRVLKDTGEEWDKNTYFDSEGGFELPEIANPLAKSFIKPAYAIDSSEIPKTTSLKVMWVKRNNQLWQVKEIPLDKMQQATFPVRFDTVTSYYADSGDVNMRYWKSSSWANTRAGTGGSFLAVDTIIHGEYLDATNRWLLGRNLYPIDTSGLDDSANISSATFYLYYANQKNVTETTYPANVSLVEGTFSYPATLGNGNWNDLGTTRLSDTDIVISGLSGAGYQSFDLNSTGLSAISKTGWTKLAARPSNDFSDATAPTARSFSAYSFSEASGTSQDPYLEVTYTVGGGTAPQQSVIFFE